MEAQCVCPTAVNAVKETFTQSDSDRKSFSIKRRIGYRDAYKVFQKAKVSQSRPIPSLRCTSSIQFQISVLVFGLHAGKLPAPLLSAFILSLLISICQSPVPPTTPATATVSNTKSH